MNEMQMSEIPMKKMPMIDAHVHLDKIERSRIASFISDVPGLAGMIAVSSNLPSCRITEELHRWQPDRIFPAYGYHPEQAVPSAGELEALLEWMAARRHSMIAIGEVGLPYYMRQEKQEKGEPFDLAPYLDLLERFVSLAAEWNLPIVLHAVYDDAGPVCDLLERYGVQKAHFHWFKGPETAVRRMIESGYYISVTPDIVYEPEIRELAGRYPLERMMIETDGPWPFEGPFAGKETHPGMMAHAIRCLAEIKGLAPEETARILYENTVRFYQLPLAASRHGTQG